MSLYKTFSKICQVYKRVLNADLSAISDDLIAFMAVLCELSNSYLDYKNKIY